MLSGNFGDLIQAIQSIAQAIKDKQSRILGMNENAGGTLGTTWATYATLTVTTKGNDIYVTIHGYINNGNSGANRTFDLRIRRDTTVLKTFTGFLLPNIAGGQPGYMFAWTYQDSAPAAGSHTYDIQLQGSAAASVILSVNQVVVHENF